MMIRKAVIPAAGFGTRMLPAAKAVPKELLPVLDRPMIQYVVEEAVGAGVDDVLLWSPAAKGAIEDHFDRGPELEQRLVGTGGRKSWLPDRRSAGREGEGPLGAAAVAARAWRRGHQARRHVGTSRSSACWATRSSAAADALPARQLVEAYREFGTSVIGLEEVPLEKVSRYGVVGGRVVRDGVLRLDTLVEKPSPQDAPSRFAIAATVRALAGDLRLPRRDAAGQGRRDPAHGRASTARVARAGARRRARAARVTTSATRSTG